MIPLSEPEFKGNEWQKLKACLDSGWVSAAGPLSQILEQEAKAYTGAGDVVAVSSGTAALHLALIATGVQAGDLVLVSDLSFIASANVIRYCSAEPVFMETDSFSWQTNVHSTEEWLQKNAKVTEAGAIHKGSGKRISACVLVHAFGSPGNLRDFLPLLKSYAIPLIEDAAGALGSRLDSMALGTRGDFGIISLNGNKIITSGGGGLVYCKNPEDGKKIRHISRQAKVEGSAYLHDAPGYNYRLPDILAALALAQWEQLDAFLLRKQRIHLRYREALSAFTWAKEISGSQPNYWQNVCRVSDPKKFIEHLHSKGISASEIWLPLSRQPLFKQAMHIGTGAVAQEIHASSLCLPGSVGLRESEQEFIIECMLELRDRIGG